MTTAISDQEEKVTLRAIVLQGPVEPSGWLRGGKWSRDTGLPH